MEIIQVGVVGCGTMGTGITQVCAQAGYRVEVCERNDELLNKGLNYIKSMLQKNMDKGKTHRSSPTMRRLYGFFRTSVGAHLCVCPHRLYTIG